MTDYWKTTDWVESIEIFGEWGARAMEQARADEEWREWVEEG
jgi:hypothetical protein